MVRVLLLLTLLLVSCAPLQVYQVAPTELKVTEIKVVSENECFDVIAWDTSMEAKSQLILCKGDLCVCTDWEPEYGRLHVTTIPKGYNKLTIKLKDRAGNEYQREIK
jgi:hypothetical protein